MPAYQRAFCDRSYRLRQILKEMRLEFEGVNYLHSAPSRSIHEASWRCIEMSLGTLRAEQSYRLAYQGLAQAAIARMDTSGKRGQANGLVIQAHYISGLLECPPSVIFELGGMSRFGRLSSGK